MLKITLTTIPSCGRVGLLSLTSMTVMINSNDFVFVLTFLLIYVLIRSKNNWEKTVNKQCNLKFCLCDHPGRTELQTSDSNYWRIRFNLHGKRLSQVRIQTPISNNGLHTDSTNPNWIPNRSFYLSFDLYPNTLQGFGLDWSASNIAASSSCFHH